MSSCYYSSPCSEFSFSPSVPPQVAPQEDLYPLFVPPPFDPLLLDQLFDESTNFCSQPQTEAYFVQPIEAHQWIQPANSTALSNSYTEPAIDGFLDYPAAFGVRQDFMTPELSPTPAVNPSAEEYGTSRTTRAESLVSNVSSVHSRYQTRAPSPSADEMSKWGTKNSDGTWSCAYPGCTSRSTFRRGCDLRKHFKRHDKSLFCRHEGCPQSVEGGFSSKKDRARHEAKHNPEVVCEWEGCGRLFSRQDNMKDHVRRAHKRRIS